ncbi:MAG TPA: YaeQ family protein, partial [Gammaproteobacteria bacterium]
QPDERRLRKACGRARRVVVLCYGGRAATLWWEQNRAQLERHANLEVLNLPSAQVQALAAWAGRSLQLDCSVDGGVAWLSRDGETLEFNLERWRG